ncbi:MFS transporter [Sphingomonas nostoxanthinifaciens]|uniref:MFS transporter n=1 Tax=Sphingomonas nostoxanthinifaciens TaxID=2872652 RepID=UPI001CC1DBA0|nr:MFS transporter [Sphingomonas nostoxanthinifaciens]UAK23951.1 MFS transporter [Sphingomonas nostoxanthinifaciens]
MTPSFRLLARRRFLPLFATQFLGAFNDNLFKQAMILFATYSIYSDAKMEAAFNAIATGLFILPFFLLSALSGQLADSHDKAKIVRLVKTAEIAIMIVGSLGLMFASVPLMLAAVLAMGTHSTFFGPIKYAILPQHLEGDEVLGGTGLIEAGTYIAILAGTILAGFVDARLTALIVLAVAGIGWLTARTIPSAPPPGERLPLDLHVVRSSIRLVSATMHIPRLFLSICAISFFWMIGAVLVIEFPPLVKNVFTADKEVASLFLAIFSVGVAIGSVLINRLLNGQVSARFAPASVIAMAGFVLLMAFAASRWIPATGRDLYALGEFARHPGAPMVGAALLGVSITGGMFVVPLYAFLTTTVEADHTARTVAANNIVNSGAMVIGAGGAIGLAAAGVSIINALVCVAGMCLIAAAIAWKLHRACDEPLCAES